MSALFNGASYLQSASGAVDLDSSLGITVAMRVRVTTAADLQCFVEVDYDVSYFAFLGNGGSIFNAEQNDPAGGCDYTAGAIASATWVHFAYVCPAGTSVTSTIYRNGAVAGTNAQTMSVAGSKPAVVTVGSSPFYGDYFLAGSIQDVVICNRALSAGEIQELATSRMPKVGDMAVWYPFFPDGNRLKDWSGRGYDLSIIAGSMADGTVSPAPWGR